MSESRKFVAFVAIGGFCAALNFVLRFPFEALTNFEVAVALSYLCAMTAAFLLNRRFVFEASNGSWQRQYSRFGVVNIVALVQVFLITVLLAQWLFPLVGFAWHAESVAHLIGLASPIVTSYWGHRMFSFAKPKAAEARGA